MNNLSKIILLLTLLIASHVGSTFSASNPNEKGLDHHDHVQDQQEKEEKSSSWYWNYWRHKSAAAREKMKSKYRPSAERLTCDRYPRVCHVTGSPGPDCCRKKCVNVRTDSLNCGMCGNKCRYPEVCCNGTCVNPLHDKKHCGSCGNKCRRGSFCSNGMCNYA